MIEYVTGDATKPVGTGPKLLIHVCNDAGGWGAGFVLAVSKRWKEPERAYRAWRNRPDFTLGRIQVVDVTKSLSVVNMLAQEGYRGRGPHIRYDALRQCLDAVAELARERGASVHCPRIGCGLAGGRWENVAPLIESALIGVPVHVYDLPERRR